MELAGDSHRGDEPAKVGQPSAEADAEEWYWKHSHSLDELRVIYESETHSQYIRENAFLQYWLGRLQGPAFASRSDLEVILEHAEWDYAINESVYRLCREGKLAVEDAEWLVEVLPPGSFGRDQAQAYLIRDDVSVSWEAKLTRALELRADWVAKQVVSALPLDEVEQARSIIANSRRPKRTRNELRLILDQREKERLRLRQMHSDKQEDT